MDAVQSDGAAENVGVAVELGSPEMVADDGDTVATREVLSDSEAAAACDGRTEEHKQVRGGGAGEYANRFALSREIELGAGAGGCDLHGTAALFEKRDCGAGIDAGDADEPAGLPVWEGAYQQTVYQAEHGGIPADTDSEGQDGDSGKARRTAEHAGRETQVLDETLQSHETPHVAALLPGQCDIAHFAETGAPELGLFEDAMRFDFLGEVAVKLRAAPSKEDAAPSTNELFTHRLSMEVSQVFLWDVNRRFNWRPLTDVSGNHCAVDQRVRVFPDPAIFQAWIVPMFLASIGSHSWNEA